MSQIIKFDKEPREMLPGTIVLPCNTVFIIKSISNFDARALTANCSVTIVVFIKCNVGEA